MEKIKDDSLLNIKEILESNGFKFTQQRRAIFNVMLDHKDEHLNIEEVFSIVREREPDIGIATVYRTLGLFEELNIVSKVNFDDGYSRYELGSEAEYSDHHHLICLNCGGITEIKLNHFTDLEDSISRSEEFDIVNHNLKFYGYCKNCRN